MTKEQEKLVVDNIGLIYYVANKFNLDIDELIDIGYIGLCKGALSFDKNNKNKANFATYAIHCIHNEYVQFFHTNGSYKRKSDAEAISIYLKAHDDMEDVLIEDTLYSNECSVEDLVTTSITIEEILKAIRRKPRYRRIVELLIEGYNQTEIAEILNMKKQSVSSMIGRIRNIITEKGVV